MLKEIVIAIQSWGEAHHFILKHKLWKWVLIPGLIYTILFVIGIYFFGRSATDVVGYITHILHLGDWSQRFHNSFLGFLFTFAGITIWLTLLLFYFSFLKYLCLIIGAPVFAYLSRKTESIIENNESNPGWDAIWPEAVRGIKMAMRNCGWQTVYLVALLFLALIPLIGWITPLIVLFMECYYYGFSMVDYGLARKQFSASQSTHYIGRHKGLAIGNGILFYLMHVVVIFAPAYAIVAGTLTAHKVKGN
ncbi:MAG: EI24 domain-containing protein [Chitinophagaceae bacterium]|nr:EI24 domain-containing protein [Chitinophagaceae bacterium]